MASDLLRRNRVYNDPIQLGVVMNDTLDMRLSSPGSAEGIGMGISATLLRARPFLRLDSTQMILRQPKAVEVKLKLQVTSVFNTNFVAVLTAPCNLPPCRNWASSIVKVAFALV
jgi:hypothetical protein